MFPDRRLIRAELLALSPFAAHESIVRHQTIGSFSVVYQVPLMLVRRTMSTREPVKGPGPSPTVRANLPLKSVPRRHLLLQPRLFPTRVAHHRTLRLVVCRYRLNLSLSLHQPLNLLPRVHLLGSKSFHGKHIRQSTLSNCTDLRWCRN